MLASTHAFLHLVINLPSSSQRRTEVLEQAHKLNLSPQFVDGEIFDETKQYLGVCDKKRRSKFTSRPIGRGEHGCLVSHLKALDLFLQSDYEYCVICEDDVNFEESFLDDVQYVISHTQGWDILKLYNEGNKFTTILPLPDIDKEISIAKKISWGALCNLYTRKAAETILKASKTYVYTWDPHLLNVAINHDLVFGNVFPNLIHPNEHNDHSTIAEMNAQPMPQVVATVEDSNADWKIYWLGRFKVWHHSFGKWTMQRRLQRHVRLSNGAK